MGDEMWGGPATDPVHGSAVGNVTLFFVHSPDECQPWPCVLHRPSDHHMRDWPTLWRADKRIMERTCPHGVGHPDVDDLAYHVRNGRGYLGIHGCCGYGCCRTDGKEAAERDH